MWGWVLLVGLVGWVIAQNSPLNIDSHQVEMIAYRTTQDTAESINITVRFPVSASYWMVFRFRKVSLAGDDNYIYYSFNTTDPSDAKAIQMKFIEGVLGPVIIDQEVITAREVVRAESYIQFRLNSSYQLPNWGKNSIYELDVFKNPSMDLSKFESINSAYFHTFVSDTQKFVLLPRFRMNDTLVTDGTEYQLNLFTGGIGFNSNSVYFIALIIQHNYTSDNVNMWGGFSFSRSHINRDMITFRYTPTSIEITDAFSLLGLAPYDDLSANVGGARNIQTVSSQQLPKSSVVLVRRLYETKDQNGDEAITSKLNQEFCLALNTRKPAEPLSIQNSEIHNYLKCITPNIELASPILRIIWVSFLIILIF